MKRKIYNKLLEWKNSEYRVPLIITGARQTGKTYILNEFAKEYKNFVYCTLEIEKPIRDIFDKYQHDPKLIIKAIANYKNIEIIPNQTLVILDEIQACPIAITMLKYFNEQCNEYHIIASGSLLGVSINRNHTSFPVGKVQMMQLRPLDFEEFIDAVEKDTFLKESIINSYKTFNPLPNHLHEQALKLYKDYLFVGGMPECVLRYINSKNETLIKEKQSQIINDYLLDMAKYNNSVDIPKTRLVFNSIHTQLAKENKKFKYSLLKSGAKSKEYENAIEWLSLTGIITKNNRVEQIKLPLNNYESNDFKLYLNDVGLLCLLEDIKWFDLHNDVWKNMEFKGGLTENYVFNQLIINGFKTFYWTSNNQAEIDFIVRIGDDVVPIEVKSNDNVRSRSLNEYIKKYKPTVSIRLSTKNFGFENNIKSIPLYAIFCLKNK